MGGVGLETSFIDSLDWTLECAGLSTNPHIVPC